MKHALINDLGFTVSGAKSIPLPTQVIVHLGFVLNSISMTVSLTKDKIDNITRLGQDIISRRSRSIREAAQLSDTLVSCSSGAEYGPLYYKQLEIEKIDALKKHQVPLNLRCSFQSLLNQIFGGG